MKKLGMMVHSYSSSVEEEEEKEERRKNHFLEGSLLIVLLRKGRICQGKASAQLLGCLQWFNPERSRGNPQPQAKSTAGTVLSILGGDTWEVASESWACQGGVVEVFIVNPSVVNYLAWWLRVSKCSHPDTRTPQNLHPRLL